MSRDHDQQIKETLDLRAQSRQDIQDHFPVSFGDDLYPQASVERMTGAQKLLTGTVFGLGVLKALFGSASDGEHKNPIQDALARKGEKPAHTLTVDTPNISSYGIVLDPTGNPDKPPNPTGTKGKGGSGHPRQAQGAKYQQGVYPMSNTAKERCTCAGGTVGVDSENPNIQPFETCYYPVDQDGNPIISLLGCTDRTSPPSSPTSIPQPIQGNQGTVSSGGGESNTARQNSGGTTGYRSEPCSEFLQKVDAALDNIFWPNEDNGCASGSTTQPVLSPNQSTQSPQKSPSSPHSPILQLLGVVGGLGIATVVIKLILKYDARIKLEQGRKMEQQQIAEQRPHVLTRDRKANYKKYVDMLESTHTHQLHYDNIYYLAFLGDQEATMALQNDATAFQQLPDVFARLQPMHHDLIDVTLGEFTTNAFSGNRGGQVLSKVSDPSAITQFRKVIPQQAPHTEHKPNWKK